MVERNRHDAGLLQGRVLESQQAVIQQAFEALLCSAKLHKASVESEAVRASDSASCMEAAKKPTGSTGNKPEQIFASCLVSIYQCGFRQAGWHVNRRSRCSKMAEQSYSMGDMSMVKLRLH